MCSVARVLSSVCSFITCRRHVFEAMPGHYFSYFFRFTRWRRASWWQARCRLLAFHLYSEPEAIRIPCVSQLHGLRTGCVSAALATSRHSAIVLQSVCGQLHRGRGGSDPFGGLLFSKLQSRSRSLFATGATGAFSHIKSLPAIHQGPQ